MAAPWVRLPVPRADGTGCVPHAVSAPRARRAAPDRRPGTTPSMINYDPFLSRSAEKMKESAIRKMGGVAAQGRDIISFAPGYPAPGALRLARVRGHHAHPPERTRWRRAAVRSDARLPAAARDDCRPAMAARGAVTSVDRLLVTTGSQQGLDLVARVLADPGDAILVELPTYTGAITAFRNTQAHMIGVRQDADGISLDDLDEVWKRQQQAGRRVRFLYVVPNFQNPTGLLIGLAKRRALLEWADRRNVLIVEDDPYRDLYFSDAASESDVRPMRSDDASGRVIYLSSFSKTLAPGYRVASIDAPAALAAKFELAKQAADLCTGGLDQRVIHQACRRGVLDRQLPVLRAHYQHKRDVMVEALRTSLGDILHWPAPRGGFFLWATLPGGLDADAMIGAGRGERRHLRRGGGVLRGRLRRRSRAAVVLGADAGADHGRRRAVRHDGTGGAGGGARAAAAVSDCLTLLPPAWALAAARPRASTRASGRRSWTPPPLGRFPAPAPRTPDRWRACRRIPACPSLCLSQRSARSTLP